ncbi:MAG: alpha/beta fold hydrolase [Candidatus Binataceae bacterium]
MATIHTDLLEAEIRYYDTGKYRTRAIEIKNDKLPIILTHGGGGHAEAYSRNLRRLSQVARPIAIDFIWHGLSSKPKFWSDDPKAKQHWLNQFTDQVLELMDHLKIEKAVIEGESLGGWIAYDMGIHHPDRTAALVLNTSWGMKFEPGSVKESDFDLNALRETSVNALKNPTRELIRKRMEWLMPLGGVTDEIIDTRIALWSRPDTRDALLEYYDHLFGPRNREFLFTEADLSKIKAKTLILWTDHNPVHGPDAAERLRSVIPNSSVAFIKNAAHWPQWEQAEEHDRLVSEFLRSL